jgi:hypothetical protein
VSAVHEAASVIENLEFLDEANVGANEAAERAGFPNAEAMEKWLERHDAYDLWLGFKKRDPVGYHDAGQRRARAAAESPDPVIAVLDAADESTRAATRRKAERARALLSELRATVAAEKAEDEQRAEAQSEIDRLQRELADAKAKLRGGVTATVTRIQPKGDHPCSGCGKPFDTPQGKSLHERRHCPNREASA